MHKIEIVISLLVNMTFPCDDPEPGDEDYDESRVYHPPSDDPGLGQFGGLVILIAIIIGCIVGSCEHNRRNPEKKEYQGKNNPVIEERTNNHFSKLEKKTLTSESTPQTSTRDYKTNNQYIKKYEVK